MARQVNVSDSLTFHPSSLDTTHSRYASVSSSYPIDNGYTDATSSSYAQFVLTTGSGAATYVYYNFDTSAIPEGATIDSVACQAKGYVSTTSSRYISTRQMQMYWNNNKRICDKPYTVGKHSNIISWLLDFSRVAECEDSSVCNKRYIIYNFDILLLQILWCNTDC